MNEMKLQAWSLLAATSLAFGYWQHSIYAGLFFFFLTLLVGTVITGFMRTDWSDKNCSCNK